jgi:protocatechuate 3,4-dioxygenase beta subunit
MRVAAIMLVLAATACGQTPPNDKGAIEGSVVNLRGEPLRKTTLKLRAMRPGFQELNTSTDNDGKFVFEGLDPAPYLLSAEHAGYLNQGYGSRTPGLLGGLDIRAGSRVSDVIIAMTPQGIIAGKVTDEDGDPVAGVQVNVYEIHWFINTRGVQLAGSAALNPDGTYMVGNLMPGRYYVGASAVNSRPWLTSWFPDTTDFSSASRIDLSPGADIRGIDLRVRRGAAFQIRGTITGAPTEKVALRLIPKGHGPGIPLRREIELPPSGAFALTGVAPGSYTIVADSAPLVGYVSVKVSDRDAAGVAIALGPGLEIGGKIRMLDGSAPTRDASINLIDRETWENASDVEIDAKGNFRIPKLAPVRYWMEASGPSGSYTKSIRFAGRDIARDDLDLTAGIGGTMEIVLSPNAASITGVVRDKDGNPAPFAMFELWSASHAELPRASNADANGRFELSGLTPGDYRVAAWDTASPSLLQNPDFLAHFEGTATKVSLAESATVSVEVTMNDADSTAAAIAKLP